MAKISKLEHPAVAPETPQISANDPSKVLAAKVELGLGTHLLGTMLSLKAQRGNELEITPLGIVATSGKNKRQVLIPWTNIKACELMPKVQAVAQPKPVAIPKAA